MQSGCNPFGVLRLQPSVAVLFRDPVEEDTFGTEIRFRQGTARLRVEMEEHGPVNVVGGQEIGFAHDVEGDRIRAKIGGKPDLTAFRKRHAVNDV